MLGDDCDSLIFFDGSGSSILILVCLVSLATGDARSFGDGDRDASTLASEVAARGEDLKDVSVD